MSEDTIWSLADAAEHLKCCGKSVQKLTAEQGLPFFMIGRLWRFRRADVLAWQAAQIAATKAVA